jgi:hypothetical protein
MIERPFFSVVGRSASATARRKFGRSAINGEVKIRNRKGRGIVHCREHHAIANGIEL